MYMLATFTLPVGIRQANTLLLELFNSGSLGFGFCTLLYLLIQQKRRTQILIYSACIFTL